MATWVTECLDDLGKHIIKAAWRRKRYLYFPQEEVQVQLNIAQDTQLDDKVDISESTNSSSGAPHTDSTSEAPNNNNE